MFEWVPYTPVGSALRVTHTSCCGLLEFASEGGAFFVLRRICGGRDEETGRGHYRQAFDIYVALAEAHQAEHQRRGEAPEPDSFLGQTR
ncbi:hypothetical protein [Nonomuraea fuscirosea]|uniref:hypothetical protein n=1 Tax=Nonomuraea fuscirosea TaxID=1291556 RepID=UPI0033CC1EFE